MSQGDRILIVEDETILSDVYSMVLSLHGFMTDVAANGAEALAKIPDFQPVIILLDLLMPRMDGVTFLRAFQPALHPDVRVIVYSNLFDSQKAAEVKALGAVDIILKSSVTPEGLVNLIRSHTAAIA